MNTQMKPQCNMWKQQTKFKHLVSHWHHTDYCEHHWVFQVVTHTSPEAEMTRMADDEDELRGSSSGCLITINFAARIPVTGQVVCARSSLGLIGCALLRPIRMQHFQPFDTLNLHLSLLVLQSRSPLRRLPSTVHFAWMCGCESILQSILSSNNYSVLTLSLDLMGATPLGPFHPVAWQIVSELIRLDVPY